MKHFLSCIIFYIAITGCSGDISVLNEPDSSTTPLALTSASVADLSVTRNSFMVGEGPIMSVSLPPESEIGLTLYTSSLSDPYGKYESVSGSSENLRWCNTGTFSTQQWELKNADGSTASFYLNNTEGHALAYYPYTDVTRYAPDATGASVPAMLLEPGTIDYMYGKGIRPVNSNMPAANIALGHAMGMVSFVFTHDDKYLGNCDLQSITLKNIPRQALLTLSDGTLSDEKTPTDKSVADYDSVSQTYRSISKATPVNFRNKPNFGISSVPAEGTILTHAPRFHLFVIPHKGVSSVNEGAVYLELLIDNIRYQIPFPNDRTIADGSKGFLWQKEVNTLYRITISKNNVRLSYLLDNFEQGGDSDFEFGRMTQLYLGDK